MFSSSSLWNDKDAILRWISEEAFKFFFMQWQGCNVKMNKSGREELENIPTYSS